ncbi:unnamed protein product [Rotaria sp. Silwood1]|nr:unnamed protein product [Rotaria sp. Silwood1]CAF1191818.1 unnamed protein product [Rotaria sp. Silwood1]CAF3437518.1 unnamed protein product [Rotaria sp. Silwood1]CAF3482231.1 unnamed protein product [Rotaria sp. Silwood1]CAF4949321.1 unnamed protein product [Rotaria sp. Silwood1]
MEYDKDSCLIPLNNVNHRIICILEEVETKHGDEEDAAIRATLRLRNLRIRSSSSTSSSSVNATFNTTMTTFMPVAKSSRERDHSGHSTILTKDQK